MRSQGITQRVPNCLFRRMIHSTAENKRPFLEKLDEALTKLMARMRAGMMAPKSPASPQVSNSPRRPDPAPAMEWLRLHSKEYGGNWVALDGGRLIAYGPDAKEVYAVAMAEGVYLPMITYIEPADALPFIF